MKILSLPPKGYSMSDYVRVIPRDFFNEAKLLKCLGKLSLGILDNTNSISNHVDEIFDGESFAIRQTEDGHIYVLNYTLFSKHDESDIELFSPLNSRKNYPLYFITCDEEQYYVFDDDGNFSSEFLEYIRNI